MPDQAIPGNRPPGSERENHGEPRDENDRNPEAESESEKEQLPPLPEGVAVGCADLPPGLRRKRYFQRLGYLENEGTRFRMPKKSVLRRWVAEAEGHATGAGHFGLYAPQEITDRPGPKGYPRSDRAWAHEELWQAGGFRDTKVVRAAVQAIAEACIAVRARVVIFRSPPDFVPSASNRDTVRAFFTDIAPSGMFGDAIRVWEPLGLWEILPTARFAAELGVVVACDPLSNNPLDDPTRLLTGLPGDSVYFRITGLGRGTQRFDEYALEPLLDAVHTYRRTWIVFAHDHKYPDAIRCHRMLATLTTG